VGKERERRGKRDGERGKRDGERGREESSRWNEQRGPFTRLPSQVVNQYKSRVDVVNCFAGMSESQGTVTHSPHYELVIRFSRGAASGLSSLFHSLSLPKVSEFTK
jgi:hypothetical protein